VSMLDRYNVVWEQPGKSERDAMPLGNGEVGISLWVEEDGDLQFFLSRSDALTELDRNVKLAKVRVRLSPNPFAKGAAFREELKLREGVVEIEAADARLRVFVDAEFPVVHVTGEFQTATTVTAILQSWRTAPRASGSDSPIAGSGTDIVESADVVRGSDEGVLFYHRNGPTCIGYLAELAGLKDHPEVVPDTLGDRTFGGWMTLAGETKQSGSALTTAGPVKSFAVKVTTCGGQRPMVEAWIAELMEVDARAGAAAEARRRTAAWWNKYWDQSWIFVDGDEEARLVTQAYTLTKWMLACAAGGSFPIRFNGAHFNQMPAGDGAVTVRTLAPYYTDAPAKEPTLEVNPDLRSWGHWTLYQNLRLPYLSMLARGEARAVREMFRFYRSFWDLNRMRAKIYYGAAGQHNTEIMQTFGLQERGIYGADRTGLPVGYSQNRWGGAVDISPGLELLQLMLDYYDYTADEGFLRDELLPYAYDLLRYIETRFKERDGGKIVIGPLHAVETYWDATDPITVVAGMHAVLERVLALPAGKVAQRGFFERLRQMSPEIPVETVDGVKVIAPGRIYQRERKNVEAPEFYAMFPFRLFGVGKPQLVMAIASYRHAWTVAGSFQPFERGWAPDKASYSGWQQHGMVAATLGLTADARKILVDNCRLKNPGNRFPAMWGPIYDAVPDVDHGANILNTLQLMLCQAEGEEVLLLPAWPRGWEADFRLHVPQGGVVEGKVRGGEVVDLRVMPTGRDVRIGGGRRRR